MDFASRMRADSLYPVWRQIVGFLTFAGYAFAALMLVVSVVVAWGMGLSGVPIFFGGLFGAIMVVIFARVGKELSLMVADLSDAAVRLAAKNSEPES